MLESGKHPEFCLPGRTNWRGTVAALVLGDHGPEENSQMPAVNAGQAQTKEPGKENFRVTG